MQEVQDYTILVLYLLCSGKWSSWGF